MAGQAPEIIHGDDVTTGKPKGAKVSQVRPGREALIYIALRRAR